jgi:hypothetical protein
MAEFNMTFEEKELTTAFNMGFDTDEDFSSNVMDGVQVFNAEKHNELRGRDEADAHPISAITGLEERLSDLEDKAVTDAERESWNNKTRVYRNASGALVITF